MDEQLFRKKSMERISSPEQLDAYIRVANPGVWMVIAAVLALLLGACVWGVLGRLDTTIPAVAVSESSAVTVYVKEEYAFSVRAGMPVRIGEAECTVTGVSSAPVAADGSFSDYMLHVGRFQPGEWVYPIRTDAMLPHGVYSAQIVLESVTPISFVMN